MEATDVMAGPLLVVDIGAANTVAATGTGGVVFDEPTVVTRDSSGAVTGFGTAAAVIEGREPAGVVVDRPVRRAPDDAEVVHLVLERVTHTLGLDPAECATLVLVGRSPAVPVGQSLLDGAERAGFTGSVTVTTSGEAAAMFLGAGDGLASMVVDIGARGTRASVVVNGGVAVFASIEVGGIDLDIAVQGLVRRYDLAVPLRTAERIKHEIGSALDDRTGASSWLRGRRVSDGTVRTVGIPANEVHSAAKHLLTSITDLVNDTLDQAPHGCVDDIIATRIRLVGGGALLPGLAPLVFHRTGVRTRVADRPRHAAVLGSARSVPVRG